VRRWLVAGTVVVAATAALAAASIGSSATVASSAMTGSSAAQRCGEDLKNVLRDPSGIVKTLPKAVQATYRSWPFTVRPTPWATFAGKKPPWKIGFISFPLGVPFQINGYKEIKRGFALAKAKGLVTGSLLTYVQPSNSTATPEQQIAAIQQMVRNGVDGILINPLAGPPLAPAIDAAGKAGVPVVMIDSAISESKYSVNIYSSNNSPAGAGVLGVVKKGNILVVRGIVGNPLETSTQKAYIANVKACPGAKIVGEVVGQWSNPTAKSETLKWLAAHPGVEIAAVLQHGVMSSGIISAFEQAGRTVPPISFGGCQGGELSWWLAHSTYRTVGTCFNGRQNGWSEFRLLLRILAGNGLKVGDISVPLKLVTYKDLKVYATPGMPLTWGGEPRGPLDGWMSNKQLDMYFKKHGTPGGL
jgi:ABC-type sugar transport system substrate-binding protein